MSKIIKVILLSFAILICTAAVYWFGLHPIQTKIEVTTRQIKIKEAKLQQIKAKVAHLVDLEQDLFNAQTAERTSAQVIPVQLSLEDLYSRIHSLTKASGIKVQQMSTGQTFQPFKKDHRLQYLAVNLEGNAFFSQIIGFLNLTAQSNFLLQVENIDLSIISKGNQPRLHFKITLNAFEYSSDLI